MAARFTPQACCASQIFGGEAYDGWETMMYWSAEVAVQAYDRFFGRAGLGAMPHSVSFACCSQFAVTNETVHHRSRFFWEQNLHYLKHNNIEHDNDHSKTYMVGESSTTCLCIILNGCFLLKLLLCCWTCVVGNSQPVCFCR